MMSKTELETLPILNSARAVLSTSTRLLRAAGHADAADRIIRQATLAPSTPVVVFVGESGRGKSSLVNLLVTEVQESCSEAHGLALYRLILPATEGSTRARAAWVYPDGSRSAPGGDVGDAIGVEMEAHNGLLGEVILIDAPSAGGFSAPQALLNLKILEAATVAVFVTDAGAPLSTAEMAYLEQCSAQVESIGLVVTKTDLYASSWQDIAAQNAVLLRSRIPRLTGAFVIGVSSVIASSADSMTDASVREALLDASGLPQLVHALKQDLARAGTAPTANALRLARTALNAHRQARLTEVAVAEAPAEARAEMMAQRQHLSELKGEQQRWILDLERDLGELRAGVMHRAVADLDGWTARWRKLIQSTRNLRNEKTTHRLIGDIFAELLAIRASLIDDAEEQIGELMHGLFREVPLPAVLDHLLDSGERPAESPKIGSEKHGTGFDPTLVMSLIMGSSMGTAAAGLLALGAAVGIPFALAGAGGWFAVNRYYRQNLVEKNRLLAEFPRLAQAERVVVSDYLDARLRRLKPEIVVAYRARLQESMAGLQHLIQESHAQESRSAQASLQRIAALKREVDVVDKQLAEIDGSLSNLRRP